MKKKSKIIISSVIVCSIFAIVVCVTLIINGIKSYSVPAKTYNYTLDNTLDGDISPVVKEETGEIIKPYISSDVYVNKYYYEKDIEGATQEKSLIYYEGTYIQNNGVDYSSKTDFDVVSVLEGEVIAIDDNDIYGKTITIKHNDNLKTVYSNVTNILPSIGYKVSQGEVIALSKKDIENNELSTLHFVVYHNEKTINPESIYTLKVSDLE